MTLHLRKGCPVGVAVLVGFGAVASACGRVYEYPDQSLENTVEACSDAKDTDLDGETDCDDPDCDGFCPEESREECDDGRDNDGDGLTDSSDPRCWLLLSFAPRAERCAEASGVEIFDNFDAFSFGFASPSAAWQHVTPVPRVHLGGGRRDYVLSFPSPDAPGEGNLELVREARIRQRPFAGSWESFELSLGVSVPPQGQLRAAIVPLDLAPSLDVPLPGAETDLVSVTLDAVHSPNTLALDVEGRHFSTELPFSQPLCEGALCSEYMGELRVTLQATGFHASVTYPNGDHAEVSAPRPRSPSVPASRLVLWGGSTGSTSPVLVDDLRLSIGPEWPCGFLAPQIPGETCAFAGRLSAFGHSVSVARSPGGEYCALVTAGVTADGAPEALTAWRSSDGQIWTPASSVEEPPIRLPSAASLVGAGVAADGRGFHASLVYRDEGEVRLAFSDGESCERWGELEPGPTLPDDVEAPSYVVTRGNDQAYFTRPPTGSAPRTLWRIARGVPGAEPEWLAELHLDVGAPVSIGPIGNQDLVLAYPSASGATGAGLLVADPGLSSWSKVDPNPLSLPARVDVAQGQQLAFDDRGIAAVALGGHAGSFFLLYSGTATDGLGAVARFEPSLSVGTAPLLPAGEQSRTAAVVPPPACGDGTCSTAESCASCEADCPCRGVELLRDVFTPSFPWQAVSSDLDPPTAPYLGVEPPTLNWLGGARVWSVLPLERPITGDFELSFDVLLAYAIPDGTSCSAYIGLGGMTEPDGSAPPQSGAFARISQAFHCGDRFSLAPFALTEAGASQQTEGGVSCVAAEAPILDAWHPVVLRRRGSELSVAVPRADGCGTLESSVTVGATGPLPALVMGFGGGSFEDCGGIGEKGLTTSDQDPPALRGHSGAFKNLTLRLLEDPGRCPEGTTLCDSGSEEPSCVDTSRSAEHCGECGTGCAPHETCEDGTCVCNTLRGVADCAGSCVDKLSATEHCGGCGALCEARCVRGVCVATAECAVTSLVPPEGGIVPVESAPDGLVTELCGGPVFGGAFVVFSPEGPGLAHIELEGVGASLGAVIGITEDPSCGSWLACSDDEPGLELGASLRFPVVSGATYLVGTGLREPFTEPTALGLRIGVEP